MNKKKKTILINFDNICLYGNKLYQVLHLAKPNKRSLWKKMLASDIPPKRDL